MVMPGIGQDNGWGVIAQIAAVVSTWAAARARESEMEALTLRLQHPVQWTIRHPLRAAKRALSA